MNNIIKIAIGVGVAIGGWLAFEKYVESLPEPPKKRGRKRNPEKLSKSTYTDREWAFFEDGRKYESRN